MAKLVQGDRVADTSIPANVQLYAVDLSGHLIPVRSNLSGRIRAVVDSGVGTLISGQMIQLQSGYVMQLASGQFINTSGQGVLVQSGIEAIWRPDKLSGLETIHRPALLSGLFVSVSGQMVQLRSGYVIQLASGQHVIMSGQGVLIQSGVGVQVNSGVGVLIGSGLFVSISGQMVDLKSGIKLEAQTVRNAHLYEGRAFVATDYDTSIDETSGDEKIWLITTPDSAVRTRFEFDVGVSNEALIELRENPTIVSSTGAAVVVYNADRNSATSAYTLVYKDRGIQHGTGTQIAVQQTASTGAKEIMADGIGGKFILKQNEDYIIVVTPANAATKASLIIKLEEES